MFSFDLPPQINNHAGFIITRSIRELWHKPIELSHKRKIPKLTHFMGSICFDIWHRCFVAVASTFVMFLWSACCHNVWIGDSFEKNVSFSGWKRASHKKGMNGKRRAFECFGYRFPGLQSWMYDARGFSHQSSRGKNLNSLYSSFFPENDRQNIKIKVLTMINYEW